MELDRLEKRIRALQARKAARAATFERVQGIDPTEHEAAVYSLDRLIFNKNEGA